MDPGDGTIQDTCTGLQWERKTAVAAGSPPDLHDVDNRYSWAGCCDGDCTVTSNACQPNAAAAAICSAHADGGTQGCSICASGTCNVDPKGVGAITTVWEWLSEVNAEKFGGYDDWRLPSEGARNPPATGTNELETILLAPFRCVTSPCITPIFGPTSTVTYYVSASTEAGDPDKYAWGVSFDDGRVTGTFQKVLAGSVRAVRSPCTSARCTLATSLTSGACVGQGVPSTVTERFDLAARLIERAGTSGKRQAKKVVRRATTALRRAKVQATRAAKGGKAKISPACAAALREAVEQVLATLG